jgi:hypothetical protein
VVAISRPCVPQDVAQECGFTTTLYRHVNPATVRYDMVTHASLEQLDDAVDHVVPNATHKTRYFLVFQVSEGVPQVAMIPYATHCASDQIRCAHVCADAELFRTTVVDGDLVQDSRGNMLFLMTDVYAYCGESWKDKPVAEKRRLFRVADRITYDANLSSFQMCWIASFPCDDLATALQASQPFDVNGIVLIQCTSGPRLVYRATTGAGTDGDAPSMNGIGVGEDAARRVGGTSSCHEDGERRRFSIQATSLPDVFPLVAAGDDYGYLRVPTLKWSLRLRELTRGGQAVTLVCVFLGGAWVPKSVVSAGR